MLTPTSFPFRLTNLPATSTESTLHVSIARTTAPVALLNGATLMLGRVQQHDVGLLPGRERADLVVEPVRLRAADRRELQHVAGGQQLRAMLLQARVGDLEVEEVLHVLEPTLEREARRASA